MKTDSSQTRTIVLRTPSGSWRWSVLEFDISVAQGRARTQHQARAAAAAAKKGLYPELIETRGRKKKSVAAQKNSV